MMQVFSQVPSVLQGQDALLEQKVPGEDFDSRASPEQGIKGSAEWCYLVQSQVESSIFSGSHGTAPCIAQHPKMFWRRDGG